MKTVPVYEAKNKLSELIAEAEQGESISITRRGVPVARLVAELAFTQSATDQRQRVASALERLRQISGSVTLEGDLKTIARSGLD